MKVEVVQIERELDEHGKLYVHEIDSSVKNLKQYMEDERYRLVAIAGEKNGAVYQIASDQIRFIETSGEDTLVIHLEKECYISRARLYELECVLPGNFTRISRSVIVNLERIAAYKPLLNGLMEAMCDNGEKVYISRRYLTDLKERLREEMKR